MSDYVVIETPQEIVVEVSGPQGPAGVGGGSSNYILKAEDFTAEAGKSYAVDTSVVFESIPEHHLIYGGLYVRGNWAPGDAADFGWEVGATWLGNGPAAVGFTFPAGATLSDIIANAAGFTFSLAPGANGSDLFPEQTFTGNMGSYGLIPAQVFRATATLPTNPSVGSVITFADARGTWGDYPFTVKRSSGPLPAVVGASHKKIEGGTANFTNNSAGTFFSMVFIDNTIGWRVLSSGTKPLNLTAPTINGTFLFDATSGTWTGSPTLFSYQWQVASISAASFEGTVPGLSTPVLIRADSPGEQGNDITLNCQGEQTLNDYISSYNAEHPTATISLISGDGSQTPDEPISLSGGGTMTSWTDIEGATNSTFNASEEYVGALVRVGVIATNSNGPSAVAYSTASAQIEFPTFPLDDLVAFYKMAGTADSSENEYDLTDTNNTVFEAGLVGNAATFAFESGSRLSVDYLPWHLGSSDATFSIWMKPSTAEFGANTTVAGFYQSGGFALLLSNYGTEIYFSQGGANLMTLEAEVQNNEWIHVAFVKTSAHYKVYVNGMEETASRWNNNGVLNKGPETTTFYFGNCTPPGWPGVYNGQIDAVGFWNRALSDMEIALLYNNGDGAEP